MRKLQVERVGRSLKTTCARCGGVAWVDIGNRHRNAYCGADCRKAAMSEMCNKQTGVPCPQCGKITSFAPSRVKRGNKFCSDTCYYAYQKEHPHGGRGEKAKPRINLVCSVCGKDFTRPAGRASSIYCSKKCQKIAKNVVKTCPRCGRDFTVPVSNADRYTFCSIKCSNYETTYTNCKRCGKPFANGDKRRKHCSEACRRPAVINTCQTCGKSFRVVPVMSYQKFCSPSCYRKYTGETEPEKNVRLCLESLGIEYVQEYVFKGWKYPVDFFLPKKNTVIEVDGEYWHNKPSVKERDQRKKDWIEARGYKVFRISDKPYYGEVTRDMINTLVNTTKI